MSSTARARARVTEAASRAPSTARRSVAPAEHPLELAAERAATRALGPRGDGRAAGAAAPPPASGVAGPARAPRLVDQALERPGQPLETSTRREFESRFGRDFSHVRVHRDELAARSARAIGAQAYSSGSHIVFGRGRFQPGTSSGRRLLAHELAHTAQQDGSAAAAVVWRAPVDLDDFDSGSFSEATLIAFLNKVRAAKKIEDHNDSDDKARGVVRRWLSGADAFALDPETKVLLVKEMQSGFTGNDDERAILNLLEKSARSDATAMFGPSGLDPDDLDDDFHGDEEAALRAFYDRLFIGGRKAAMKGGAFFSEETLPELAVPVTREGIKAAIEARMLEVDRALRDRPPAARKDVAPALARTEAPRLRSQVAALPADQHDTAVRYLAEFRVPAQSRVEVLQYDVDRAPTKEKAAELAAQQVRPRAEALLLDLAMQVASRELARGAPADPAEFQKQTHALGPEEAAAARKAIEEKSHAELVAETTGESAPDKLPFKETLEPEKSGEKKRIYGDRIKARIPAMIEKNLALRYSGKTQKEHDDKSATRTLAEMEPIANLAKDEVDRVFGRFYDARTVLPFQADQRDPKGKLVKRGNLRDIWATEEESLKADPGGYKREAATSWLFYLIRNDEHRPETAVAGTTAVQVINREHDADPKFDKDGKGKNDEAEIIRKVGELFLSDPKSQDALFRIGRGWSGYRSGDDVFVQLFKDPDAKQERKERWGLLAMLIHEYIHRLANGKYYEYARSLGGEASVQGSTLIEGVASLFAEIVWTATVVRASLPELRQVVEPQELAAGAQFDASLLPEKPNRYPVYAGAVRLVSVVGLRNLYAAFFQGRTDLIGGT